ncbi:hypothetical protein KR093_000216, partial [Drosophila rubida]
TCVYLDPIGAQLPLTGSAWPASIITLSYLLIALKYGKKWMNGRKPFDITRILIGYNLVQVIYNAIMFSFIFYYYVIEPMYNFSCMTTLPLDHPTKHVERMITYAFMINKMVDLLDTIFILLRKSYKQITTLHVFHHAVMVYITFWVHRLYGIGGQLMTMELLNTFVHTLMYSYYMISAIYPGLKGSLWWKKYITKIQIIQFVLILLHSIYTLFTPGCEYPLIIHFIIVSLSITFIVMFTTFYIRVYNKPQQQKQN